MDKVIRDGKVAVLYSPGYGAGWYSWHNIKELLFDPAVVDMVENKVHTRTIENYCREKYGEESYLGGAENLKIMWLDIGTNFIIKEYDGSESIQLKEAIDWHVA